jgi:thymidine kinase
MEIFGQAKVVVLDEAQFYPDLKEFVCEFRNEKTFIVSSLDGDYKQDKFGQVWDLIPYAQHVEKLLALCEFCRDGTVAVSTITTHALDGQVHVVGIDDAPSKENVDTFVPVCLEHLSKSYYF